MSQHNSSDRIADGGKLNRRSLLTATTVVGGAVVFQAVGVTASAPQDRTAYLTAATQETPTSGGTLRVGFYADAATMDPHFSGHKVDRQVYFNIYEALTTLGEDLEIGPGLAESWETPDPTTYILHLRQGVTFHDGTEFNADAVKVNFDRMLDPAQETLRRGDVASIESVEVVDPYTVQLNLKQPDAALLATLADRAGMIISPAAIEEFGADLARNPVGTGPFEFVEWQKDDHLNVRRFDGYWQSDLPYLDEINYRVILDDSVRVAALRNQEIDIIDTVPPRFVEEVQGDSNLALVEINALGAWWLWLNATAPPFDSLELREAFAAAIDVESIVSQLLLGIGAPANGPISAASWAYAESVPVRQRDLDLARAKLAEGGQPDGFTCTFTQVPSPVSDPIVQLIQAQVAEAGITMDIVQVDAATQVSVTVAKDFEVTWSQWSGRADPDGNTYQHFHSTGGMNYGGYSNSEVDELLDRAREVAEQEERAKLYSQVTEILNAEVAAVFIWHPDEIRAMTTQLHDVPAVPDVMMRFREAWLE